jgi:hypothetical protein
MPRKARGLRVVKPPMPSATEKDIIKGWKVVGNPIWSHDGYWILDVLDDNNKPQEMVWSVRHKEWVLKTF